MHRSSPATASSYTNRGAGEPWWWMIFHWPCCFSKTFVATTLRPQNNASYRGTLGAAATRA